MTYLKVWVSLKEALSPFSDAEKGRLFDAMLTYADSGEEPHFSGNERFIWAMVRQNIDMARSESEKNRGNVKKRWKETDETVRSDSTGYESVQDDTTSYETVRPDTEENEPVQPDTLKKSKEKKSNVKKDNYIDDNNARAIQGDHDMVIQAAEDAGFQNCNSVRARLIQLYAVHGLQKMLDGIGSCVRHGAPNLAYLEAVLKGEPKKQKPKVIAQDYEQRDYSGVQDELMEKQRREIEARIAMKKASGGCG